MLSGMRSILALARPALAQSTQAVPLPKLLGFSIQSKGPLRDIWAIAQGVLGGRTNWTVFAVGAGTLAVILLLKNSKRLPGILIAVVGATAMLGPWIGSTGRTEAHPGTWADPL
jgi:MFS superfamily sulfate permease-like transporter